MITAERLLERLEGLHEANLLITAGLNNAADVVDEANTRLTDAKADLASARAAAIAAEQIQQKGHGSNQTLRDAHERDMLKVHYQAVTVAELNLQIARSNLDQVRREEDYLRRSTRICDLQVRLLNMIDFKENITKLEIEEDEK